MTIQDLRGKKVAVVGLGVNNRRLAEHLREEKINLSLIGPLKGRQQNISQQLHLN